MTAMKKMVTLLHVRHPPLPATLATPTQRKHRAKGR
jgi:hypothetical protein